MVLNHTPKQKWWVSRSLWFTILCLVLALLAARVVMYAGAFVDETDNLVTGLLMTRGYILYEDVFSHHFPFPYFWSALVIGLFGKSIFALRLSMVAFTVGSFGVAAYFSRLRVPIGLAAFVWSIIGYIYRGNMVLYSMFSGIAIMVIFTCVLSSILNRNKPSITQLIVISIYAAIAVLSNPLSAYPILCALIFVSLTPRPNTSGLIAAGCICLLLLPYGIYLLFTNTYAIFVADSISFNSEIYNKYLNANPVRFNDVFFQLRSLLDITNRSWLNIDIMRPIAKDVYGDFDKWIFTAFLYRLALVVSCILLLVQRKYAAAAFIYLFSAAVLVIGSGEFRGAGFILVALVVACGLVTGAWTPQPSGKRMLRGAQFVVRGVVACMLIWLIVRVSTYTAANLHTYSYEATFQGYQNEAHRFRSAIACNRTDVALAFYPGEPLYYWFTDMMPVSRYTFMFPWVAEIAVPDVIKSLGEHDSAVFIPDVEIWGTYRTDDYLKDVLVYLEQNYVQVENDWYVSPAIAAQCHSS